MCLRYCCQMPLYVASFFTPLRLHRQEPTYLIQGAHRWRRSTHRPHQTRPATRVRAQHRSARAGLFRALPSRRAVAVRLAPAVAGAVAHQSRPLYRLPLFSPARRPAVVERLRRHRRPVAVAVSASVCRGDCHGQRHAPSAARAATGVAGGARPYTHPARSRATVCG
jgi:hypothetical protein